MSFPSTVSQTTSLSNHSTEFISHFFHPLELHWTWSFTSLPDIILKVMDKLNKLIRLWNIDLSLLATTKRQLPELLPLAEFTCNNTLSATTSITPFFANKSIIQTSWFHLESDIASAHAHDFVTDLMSYTNSFGNTFLKLMSIPNLLLISDDFWPWNSILKPHIHQGSILLYNMTLQEILW